MGRSLRRREAALRQGCDFYYYPGWWEAGPQLSFYVNIKQWESLPKEYQAAVETACADTNATAARYDAGNPPALRRLVGAGAILKPFPRDVLLASYKAAFEVYEETAAKNPRFRKVYEARSKFRADEDLRFRVAENTMDNFIYAQSQAKK